VGVCIKYELRTELHLRNVAHYLGDRRNPRHAEYEIPDPTCYGILSVENFVQKTVAAILDINVRRRRGRPTANVATLFIDRFADGTALTPEEEDFHERAVLKSVAADTSAIVYRHRNTETLSIDFNFLVPNVLFALFPPRTRRTSKKDPLATMKEASNAAVERLNEFRRQKGMPFIIRVSDRKKQLARARRGKLIEDELREHGSVTSANIKNVLEKLGHKVSRLDVERDTISIITRGSKQPRRFSLAGLLDAALEMSKEISSVETEKFQHFDTPRDKHLRKLAGQKKDPADAPPPVG
jgi:hypothetical protein